MSIHDRSNSKVSQGATRYPSPVTISFKKGQSIPTTSMCRPPIGIGSYRLPAYTFSYLLSFFLSGLRWHLSGLSRLPLEQRLLYEYYLPASIFLLSSIFRRTAFFSIFFRSVVFFSVGFRLFSFVSISFPFTFFFRFIDYLLSFPLFFDSVSILFDMYCFPHLFRCAFLFFCVGLFDMIRTSM